MALLLRWCVVCWLPVAAWGLGAPLRRPSARRVARFAAPREPERLQFRFRDVDVRSPSGIGVDGADKPKHMPSETVEGCP